MSSFVDNLKQRFSGNKFLSAVLTLVTGTALGQAIGLLTTPIVSRLYDTVAYGEYAILVSTGTILATVSQAGLAAAIMMPEDDEDAKKVFSAAIYFQFIVTVVAVCILMCVQDYIMVFDSTMTYNVMLAALLVYSLLANTTNLLRIYMNRLKLYRALFWNSLIGALATLLITIPAGLVHACFWGFFAAAAVSSLVCSIQMVVRANPFVRVSPKQILAILVEYKKFVLLQLPANIVTVTSQQLPNQVLSASLGSAALGSFSMSNKILGIPSRLLASPVNTVYFRTAVEYVHEGKDLASFTYSMVKKIMLCAAPLILILVVFGEPLFAFVLGKQWWEAGTISAIMAYQFALTFCITCTSYCRVSINRQGANLAMSFVSLGLVALSLFVGLSISDSIIIVIGCFAVGSCLVQIIDMAVNFVCMKKYAARYILFSLVYTVIVGGIGVGLRLGFWTLMGWM